MTKIYADLSTKLDPNCYTPDRANNPVLVLVAHNTCGANDFNTPNMDRARAQALSDTAANYLCSNDRQVSVHWLIGAEACGAPIYRIVPENATAYHCGGNPPVYPSSWQVPGANNIRYGGYGLNQVSIGIELFGQSYEIPGPNQLAALKSLVLDIAGKYPQIRKSGHIVAHKSLEGDRQDGVNWYALATAWVQDTVKGTTTLDSTTQKDPFAGIGEGAKAILKSHDDTPIGIENYEHDQATGKATMSRTYFTSKDGVNGVIVWSADTNTTHRYLIAD